MAQRAEHAHGALRIERHPILGSAPKREAVAIIFDGRLVQAQDGESLLAALLASGVRVLRTMPRTGETRGGYCLVGRCSDCLVIVDGVPNSYACMTEICGGMVVETQHGLGHRPGAGS